MCWIHYQLRCLLKSYHKQMYMMHADAEGISGWNMEDSYMPEILFVNTLDE